MIYMITGLPGNGKTLYALTFVKALAEREGRTVFYHGINGLKLDWKVVDTKPEHLDGANNTPTEVPQWWNVPAKSIVVIDEAQNCGFGVRPRGQVPEWGKKLETHRHLGIDVVLITQDPTLIDSHDRKLSELHFHVKRSFGMARAVVHEFRPVRDNVSKSLKGSIQHKWKFPKAAYAWYHSAEAHTHTVRIPMKVWVFLALPFVLAGLSWFVWTRYLDPHRERPPLPGQQLGPQTGGVMANAPAAKLTPAQYVAQFNPRVEGLAYTAPVYDEVTKPVQAPYPAACVRMASKGCGCYTQQGTKLETPQQLCEGIVAGGFFVAWDKPLQPAVQSVPPERVAALPVAATGHISLGGSPTSHVMAPSPTITGNVEQDASRSARRPPR